MDTLNTSIPETPKQGKGKINYNLPTRGRRGEVRYKNVCAACYTTENLITIRRVSGDLCLCRTHAGAYFTGVI